MPAELLLVANPTAQSGKNAERIAEVRAALDDAGLAHDFVATAPAGRTVDLIAEALLANPGIDAVAYMGGDGTFAEAAKGILRSGRASEVRLGMLPTGTANDQGKSFGLGSTDEALPSNIRVLREGLAQGHEVHLDAGRICTYDAAGHLLGEDHFFDSAGWGISPRVLALRNEDRQLIASIPLLRDLYRDQLVYAGAALRTFIRSYVEDGKFDVRVSANGTTQVYEGLTDLIVKGTRVYGGLWVFDASSRPDDGLFEVLPFMGKRDWVSKALVHLDASGNLAEGLEALGVRHSKNLRTSHVVLDFEEQPGMPLHAQIDGEEFAATARAVIEVLPRAIRLVVPKAWLDEEARLQREGAGEVAGPEVDPG